MPKQAKQPSDNTGIDTPIQPFNSDMAESCARASQAIYENAVSMNQEIVRFAGERFQKDVAALQAMSGCTNWLDAVALQSNFFQSATDAYQTEIKKLWEQGTQAASEASGLFGEAVSNSSAAGSRTGQK